jgi:hypothetical protein
MFHRHGRFGHAVRKKETIVRACKGLAALISQSEQVAAAVRMMPA